MRKTLVSLAGLLLLAAAASAAPPCAPSTTSLCLSGGRFEVSVAWSAQNKTGDGQAVSLTADTGYFWFFSDSNVELIVKVLDATAINGKFWVFFGALSNVEYTLTVRDSVTGTRKQYQNPSGQFASVGDTQAFSGSVDAPPTSERVVARGTGTSPESIGGIQEFIDRSATRASRKAATDFTPCNAGPTQLFLSGCRFKVEATWQDSQGHSGYGQAVQLTSDTGYLWFFSATNVELMVKVLDARAINGNFWVFFGALSNVQYRITVYDTLSGDVKVYTNAQGTFASLGDTAAFQPGPSVTVSWDDAHAASDRFDEAGGTLTATGGDGTQFVLTIPPGAIVFPVRVTMTPVSQITGLPIGGPVVGAVQIEPDGLLLMEAADLKILPATAPSLAGLTYFRYRGPGESYTPYPGVPQSTEIDMPVTYLGGYGAANGAPSGALTRRTIRPKAAGALAPYIARAADLYRQHLAQQLSYEDYLAQVYPIWSDAWGEVVSPALEGLSDSCDLSVLESVFQMALEFRNLDPQTDPHWMTYSDGIFSVMHEKVLTCIDEAYQRCKANNDPSEVMLIEKLSTLLQRIGLMTDGDQAAIRDKIDRCLRFELDFESGLTVGSSFGSASLTEQLKVRAITPLQLEASGAGFVLSGSSQISHEFVSIVGPPCTYSVATKPDTFAVSRLDIGLFTQVDTWPLNLTFVVPTPRDQMSVDMIYSPGDPQEQMTQACPYPGTTTTGPFQGVFAPIYALLHQNEAVAQGDYIVTKWDPIRSGSIFAKLEYNRTMGLAGVSTSEDTFITLKHTPQ